MATLEELLATLPEGTSLEGIERRLPPHGTDELARTAWGEARSEGPEGMRAVAHVARNRVGKPGFAKTIEGVVKQPKQFSAWNPDDPNAAKMADLTEADENFRTATDIARRVLSRELPDVTGGATQYHRVGKTPKWASAFAPTKTVGKHQFYKKERKKRAATQEETGGPTISSVGLD